jgi:hypothetical protein
LPDAEVVGLVGASVALAVAMATVVLWLIVVLGETSRVATDTGRI